MTPTETSRVIYAGNGVTTAFSTAFYFLAQSELQVILKPSGGSDILQTLGVHYTVTTPTPGSGAAGTVTMLAAPAAGDTLTIQRDVPFTQNVALRSQGSFSPATHENIADELTFQTQQLDRRVTDIEAGGLTGTFTAGNGLSVAAGPVLNVGGGAGIQSNADDIEVLYGAVGVIADVTKAAASAGAANTAARSDHKHNVSTAAPGAIAVNGVAAEGGATSLARSDHTHTVARGAPVQLTTTAAVTGASGNFSDADHKHEVRSEGVPLQLTDTVGTAGVGPGFSTEGHQHPHGVRAGGTLHAEATGGAAGFMPAAMWSLLNGALALKSHVHAFQAAAQTHATGAGANCVFGTEDYDTNGEYDPATGIFTAKDPGYLHVAIDYSLASAAWVATNLVTLQLIRNNGADVVEATATDVVDANVTEAIQLHVCKVVKVAIGETVRAFLSHNQGGNVNSGGTRATCSMTLHRVV